MHFRFNIVSSNHSESQCVGTVVEHNKLLGHCLCWALKPSLWKRRQKLLTHQEGYVLMMPAEGLCHEAVVFPFCVCVSNCRVNPLTLEAHTHWLMQEHYSWFLAEGWVLSEGTTCG